MNKINWASLTCQDASPMSKEEFIPCGRPASTIVWLNKDRRGYAMCDMCGDHNVKNRGGILLAQEGPRRVVIHNGRFSYQLIIGENRISFTGGYNADYFENHYRGLGYDVKRSGDGSEDYDTWVADHGEPK